MTDVDLGFAEESDAEWLTNRYFPSKIGGKPAWLELDSLPKPDDLICKKCHSPKSFLCQIYSPGDDEVSFHRTIFVFLCRTQSCQISNSAENFSVLRSQLPLKNDFYSEDPPVEDGKPLPQILTTKKLCLVCGCYAPHSCGQCKAISYCSTKHQKAHWPYHKATCLDSTRNDVKYNFPEIIFPEYEIVIQNLNDLKMKETNDSDEDRGREQEHWKEYEKLAKEGGVGVLNDVPAADIEQYLSTSADKQFEKFKKEIASAPDQVIRYNRGGSPIWMTDLDATLGHVNIPNCEACGGERQFEFQIMPQMLNFLKDDRLDWGILAIYTCSKSCNPSSEKAYNSEFILKQDVNDAKK